MLTSLFHEKMVKSRQHLAVQSEAPLAGEGQCTRWAQPKRHCRPGTCSSASNSGRSWERTCTAHRPQGGTTARPMAPCTFSRWSGGRSRCCTKRRHERHENRERIWSSLILSTEYDIYIWLYIYMIIYIYIYDYLYIYIWLYMIMYDYIFFRQRRRTIAGFDMVFLSRLPTKTDNNTAYKVPYHFYPKKKTEVCTSQGTFSGNSPVFTTFPIFSY